MPATQERLKAMFSRSVKDAGFGGDKSGRLALDSNTLMAPVPPSTRRADVNASTGAVLRRIMFTAVLMHRSARPRIHALAVDDAHAAQVVRERIGQEFAQRGLGLVDAQPVQIAHFLDAVFTALELAHHAVLHTGAAKGDLVAGVGDLVHADPCRLSTSTMARSAAVNRARAGGLRLAGGTRARGRDRLDVAHRLAKHIASASSGSVRLPLKLPPR